MKIAPAAASFPANGKPASFSVDTAGARFYAVQVATDASLLNGALAARRTPPTFFDSWVGDDAWRSTGSRTFPKEVPGVHLEAPTGRATYTLPGPVWRRFARAQRLFYRLLTTREEKRRPVTASVADVDWARAPSVSLASAPSQPVRAPAARFRGAGVLSRADLVAHVKAQIGKTGIVSGRDGDFAYAFLDSTRFRMSVVECHEHGLTDTVAAMPRRPAAVINGQFLSGAVGIDTQGQVIREERLIHADSQATRSYLVQTRDDAGASFRMGTGNPATAEPGARAGFGGLGPVLSGGAPPASLTPFAASLYAMPRDTGRGVIAHHPVEKLILLLVQKNVPAYRHLPLVGSTSNAMTLGEIRTVLQALGFADAVCNDGSDSEALFAGGAWLVRPGLIKDEVMDFAIGFVDDNTTTRLRVLVVDGTQAEQSEDGIAIAAKVARPASTAYAPRSIATELRARPEMAPIATALADGVLQAEPVTGAARIGLVRSVVAQAGAGSSRANLVYVSSHSTRHGVLFYHPGNDVNVSEHLANPWAAMPSWGQVRWLILAGCAVLGLRYTRGIALTAKERAQLVSLHHDMHGPGAGVPGLAAATKTAFVAYHPGWGWWSRVFRRLPELRGVLGYWYRSLGKGHEVPVIADFGERIAAGEPFLDAWEVANKREFWQIEARWAAMVRGDCRRDRLAGLEARALPSAAGEWLYFDRFQNGVAMDAAYRAANRLDGRTTCGGVRVSHSAVYDDQAIEELTGLAPAAATHLVYDDGMGP